MTCCSPTCKKIAVICLTLIVVILGICLVSLWKVIYNNVMNSELKLSNSSTSYKMWVDTPIPIMFEIYLFNWTNSEQVLKNWDVKPIVEERGPYTFSEHHQRVNLQWHKNNTITYQQIRTWHFIPEKSNGSLSDSIITINPVAATVANFIKDKSAIIQNIVDVLLEHEERSLAIKKTVNEFLYEGYDDKLLQLIKKANISGLNIPFDKFGWFYSRNGSATYDGTFTMFTGDDDLNKLGEIENWNYNPFTNYYHGKCNQVKGTSGELWPPVKNANELFLFVPDTCSYVTLDYKQASDVQGIVGNMYIGSQKVLDNGTKFPQTACFNGRNVERSGVRDVSKCKFGAPAFVSYPHFYLSDDWYKDRITGMQPDKDKHELFIVLEPNTGIPLHADAKLQLNLMVDSMEHLKMFKNIKKTFMPMLWFRQSAMLTPDLTSQVKMIIKLPAILEYTGYGLICLFLLFIVIVLFVHFRKEWRGSDTQQLIPTE